MLRKTAKIRNGLIVLATILAGAVALADASTPERVTSVYVSQDFLNEELQGKMKNGFLNDLKIQLDPDKGDILLRGLLQVPLAEMRALNLDPALGSFRFQVAVRPKTTRKGYLILQFPLNQTYFYPSNTEGREEDRVIVPVQMLSLALASARSYLAALAGDFSGFERRSEALQDLMKGLGKLIKAEKNPDARAALVNQRETYRLQLAAVPIERRQLEALGKQVQSIFSFTGEKELNLNDELGAHKNTLVLKIDLARLVPYLKGVELGGVRLVHDKKDGNGQNYMSIDINALTDRPLVPIAHQPSERKGMKVAPSAIIRLRQALFESNFVMDSEKKTLSNTSIRDLDLELKDDGLHVSGRWHKFFFSVPFQTTVDFVSTGPDVFQVRVREIDVAGLDLEFLTQMILEAVKTRLEQSLKGICTFEYVGEIKDHSRAMQVTVNPKALSPALASLHLVDVDIREREFLMKVGHPEDQN